jgi:hypothetical protein
MTMKGWIYPKVGKWPMTMKRWIYPKVGKVANDNYRLDLS